MKEFVDKRSDEEVADDIVKEIMEKNEVNYNTRKKMERKTKEFND